MDWGEFFNADLEPLALLVPIVVIVVASYVLDGAARLRRAWGWSRDLRHRWRAKRRGVRMDPWQRRTGRHDSWS